MTSAVEQAFARLCVFRYWIVSLRVLISNFKDVYSFVLGPQIVGYPKSGEGCLID